MSGPTPADGYFSIPELMRIARGTYKRAADARLAAGGFEDLPTASGYLLAYLANDEDAIVQKVEGLGIKGSELHQLVDTLVLRGYITRSLDPSTHDESLSLTERGRAANEATSEATSEIDRELERRLTAAEMAGLRRGLAALGEIKRSLTSPAIRRGLPH